MTKYCLPIIKNSGFEIHELIEHNIDKFEYFEIWIDYVESFDSKLAIDLLKNFDNKLIFVTRRQSLAPIKLKPEIRYELIETVSTSNALLDLDVTTQKLELEYIQRNKLKPNLILSYHNYELTPPTNSLNEIISVMEEYKPSIYKLATYCPDNETALRLLRTLLNLRSSNKKVIIIGMGELGKITRLYGALWGNEITFAPLSADNASAPGQLTRYQYDILIKELGV